ncbi:mechanosensitive ion channel family protein [Halomicrobium sp. HM KBTZ05]|uniref:mechanosensitive ion channel family protein n=1 Tax=Halomicrobium sp. HM KBTZ05 TaxID=3242663 RepID=UPI003557704B
MLVQQRYLTRLLDRYLEITLQAGEFLAVAATVYFLGRLVLLSGGDWLLARARVDPTFESALRSILHLLVGAVAVLVGAGVAGYRGELAGSTVLVAGITLAIGLAAQDVLSNFVAGAFIVQDPDLNVGDTIRWNDTEGLVRDIDLRVTRVQTPANATVLVPNSELATSAVTNLTSEDPQAIVHEFGIDYDEDVDRAGDEIVAAAEHVPRVRSVPSPSVEVVSLDDTAVVLTATIWLDRADRSQRATVQSQFLRAVHERFRAAGIDLTETTQHELSGAVRLADGDEADASRS